LFFAVNLYFFSLDPHAWKGMFEIPLAELIISNNFAFPFKIGLGQELEN